MSIRHPFFFALGYAVGLHEPYSETTIREREMLRRHAAGRHCLAEIGVLCGVNSRQFRSVMAPDGIVVCVDPFPRKCFGLRGFGGIRWVAHRELARVRRGRVVWAECLGCEAPAQDAVRAVLPVDFLFIDGDHRYQGVRGDWEAWRDHVAQDAIVAFHDSRETGGLGPERFVNAEIATDSRFTLIDAVDRLSVFRYRGSTVCQTGNLP